MDPDSLFWCYRCIKFVRDSGVCPECDSRSVEEIEFPSPSIYTDQSQLPRFISDTIHRVFDNVNSRSENRPPRFNLVVVVRGGDGAGDEESTVEAYFDKGSGLQPAIHDSFIESGYDRVLTQFPHPGSSARCSQCNQEGASKAVVVSLPVIEISDSHVSKECAVCNESFELGSKATEMPWKHIYHADCILPWLSKRNSCPVCRQELPTHIDGAGSNTVHAAPRVILCITDRRRSSGIRKVIRKISSFFRRSSSNSRNSCIYWELVDSGELHWHTLG
ncbi:hypothetical protein MKW94_014549 [Papaver nudicaule]|uniref:RING-type domain-containing protein n=1 Tax=Papaver nudicaule TaxID=74823 RepID=A0AA41VCU6_PAPNU|nr:hypothetical protein [Papaver nudicaule]